MLFDNGLDKIHLFSLITALMAAAVAASAIPVAFSEQEVSFTKKEKKEKEKLAS